MKPFNLLFLIACACHLSFSPSSSSQLLSPPLSLLILPPPFSLCMLCVHVSYHDIITSPTDYIQLYYIYIYVCVYMCMSYKYVLYGVYVLCVIIMC